MRLLVLTHDIGKTAPGIVFERLLSGLTRLCEIDVVTCNYAPSIDLNVNGIQIIHYPQIRIRLAKFLFVIFKTDIVSCVLKRRVKVNRDYDFVLSLCSSGFFFGVISGLYVSKKINTKWGCYCVDAIPAPIGWSKDTPYFRASKSFVKKSFANLDFFAAVNEQMLEYEVSLFSHKNTMRTTYLVPPSLSERIIQLPIIHDRFWFLFAGNIYGMRKSKYVIEAFSKLVSEYENIGLLFVGNIGQDTYEEIANLSDEVKEKIEVFPRMTEIVPFYERASVLLDIDADLENDVYLSSKISTYLGYNRPIICESSEGTPSRSLLSGIDSIIHCHHKVDEIQAAMSYTIEHYTDFDYSDRNELLHSFSSEYVASVLYDEIKCIV